MSTSIINNPNPWDVLIKVYLCFIIDHHINMIKTIYKILIENDDKYHNIILTYYFIILINQALYCFKILYSKKRYRSI